MSDELETAADASGSNTPAKPLPVPAKTDVVEGTISYKEIVGLRKETRELIDLVKQGLKPPTASVPAPVVEKAVSGGDDVKQLRKEMEFKDLLAEQGITSAAQRKTLTKLWNVDAPPDVGAWLKETSEGLGIKLGASTAVAKEEKPAPSTPSDQGDPAANRGQGGVNDDLRKMSPSDIKALGPEGVKQLVNRITNGGGVSRHYANIKRAHER